jgi:hypothetical protein
MGAIRTKEKNHGIEEESNQEAQQGQESSADDYPKVLIERFFIHVTANGGLAIDVVRPPSSVFGKSLHTRLVSPITV